MSEKKTMECRDCGKKKTTEHISACNRCDYFVCVGCMLFDTCYQCLDDIEAEEADQTKGAKYGDHAVEEKDVYYFCQNPFSWQEWEARFRHYAGPGGRRHGDAVILTEKEFNESSGCFWGRKIKIFEKITNK